MTEGLLATCSHAGLNFSIHPHVVFSVCREHVWTGRIRRILYLRITANRVVALWAFIFGAECKGSALGSKRKHSFEIPSFSIHSDELRLKEFDCPLHLGRKFLVSLALFLRATSRTQTEHASKT